MSLPTHLSESTRRLNPGLFPPVVAESAPTALPTPQNAPKCVETGKAGKRQRVERTRNGGTWTESAYWGRIRGALRKTFAAWVPMNVALKAARRPSQRTDRPLLKWEYQCAKCRAWFPLKEEGAEGEKLIQVDHVNPVGSLKKLEDLPGWVARLTEENPECYRILCVPCHQLKTNAERTGNG